MKTFMKLLVVLAALAGIAYLIVSLLNRDEEEDYISIYGDPQASDAEE
ncbi:hypothetical protein [uncultured Gemmiger sp.]|nr:hypothetical protein [uncultured Gemmiger sp.]